MLTSYPGIAQEVIAAGGSYLDQPVKVDGNLITSRTPEDEPVFIEEIINKLGVTAY
ncbi:putative cysteine protease YraA [compost metagenome]